MTVDELHVRDLHLERLRRQAAARCEKLEVELRDAKLVLAALDNESARNSLAVEAERKNGAGNGAAKWRDAAERRKETRP